MGFLKTPCVCLPFAFGCSFIISPSRRSARLRISKASASRLLFFACLAYVFIAMALSWMSFTSSTLRAAAKARHAASYLISLFIGELSDPLLDQSLLAHSGQSSLYLTRSQRNASVRTDGVISPRNHE